MKPWIFPSFKDKDKDPDVYNTKILIYSLLAILISKGIVTKEGFDMEMKKKEEEVGEKP